MIHLSDERWRHILNEHPKLTGSMEHIKETLATPLAIKQSVYGENVHYYYRWYKERKRYLFVAVKYLNGSGHIITAFYMRAMKQ